MLKIVLPALLGLSWLVLVLVVLVVPEHWPVLGLSLGLVLTTVASGSVQPSWQFFGRSWSRNPIRRDAIALTFDDGPDPIVTRAVAAALESRGWRGTFFVVGRRVVQHPEVLRELMAAGHQIGLHGHEHAWHLMLREPLLVEDLLANDAAVYAAVGRHARWYRSPIGLVSPPLMNVLRQWRLFYAGFSVRPFDGAPGALTAAELATRVQQRAQPGDVVLLHDAPPVGRQAPAPPVVAALPGIIDHLAARGLVGVTMSELFDQPAWFEEHEVSEVARRAFRRGRLQLMVWATTAALLVGLLVMGAGRPA